MFAHGETLTVRRAPVVLNGYGDYTRDWSEAVAFWDVSGAAVWETSAAENTDSRNATVSTIGFAVPPGTDVHAYDRIVWRGAEYDVIGEPFLWRNPMTGWTPGIAGTGRAVQG